MRFLTRLVSFSCLLCFPTYSFSTQINFSFEEFTASGLNSGTIEKLVSRRDGLTLELSRPGSNFDIVSNTGGQTKAATFGNRSLSPFFAESSNTPFIANFSERVRAVTIDMGDYGADSPDILQVEGYSKLNAGGDIVGNDMRSLETLPGNPFRFKTVEIRDTAIQSIKFIGGTPSFPNSVFYDNINVTPLVGETPVFKQGSAPWGSTTLLNSTDSFANYGCFITSTAMILNSLGHNTDPGKLNDFLKPYMKSTGLLTFSNIPLSNNYGQTDGETSVPVRFVTSGLPTGASRAEIVSFLSERISSEGPIILRVPSRNKGIDGYGGTSTHAIVAYEVEGDQVFIRDPGWSSSPSTLDGYIDFVNSYVAGVLGRPEWQLRNVDGSVDGHDLSWLLTNDRTRNVTWVEAVAPGAKKIIQGTVNSPVEVVITDPQGRRLGFDPIAGALFNEIPDSAYFRDLVPVGADDGISQPVEHLPLQFSIGEFLEGNYLFEIFGTGYGPWSLNFGVSSSELGFDPFQFRFSGTASLGSFESFTQFVATVSDVAEPNSAAIFVSIVLLGLVLCRYKHTPAAHTV